LMAIAHSGGYVCGAIEVDADGNERLLGASVGFLARHQGRPALHSHITGLLPGAQHAGIGRAIKLHQRAWARDNDIDWIVWTYDPLVRRNAWFNIEVLGAHVSEYVENFYGVMTDSINAHDESDRLVVAWPTDPSSTRPTAPDGAVRTTIPTPEDIVVLRRTDPTTAAEWRHRVRDGLAPALSAGSIVTGFTRDGEYVVSTAP